MVKLWDMRMGAEICTLPGPKVPANKCAFDPSGKVSSGWLGGWLAGQLRCKALRFSGPPAGDQAPLPPTLSPGCCCCPQVLAVASDDGKVRLYVTRSGEQVAELGGHDDAAQAVAFDPAGHFLVTGGSDNTFRLWA